MMLGVLSDTHNNAAGLRAALELFRKAGVTTLIHCGDVTTAEMLPALAEFRVHLVFGNLDFASGEMEQTLKTLHPGNTAGLVFSGDIGGVQVAATHGHLRELLDPLIESGHYAYVFHGHTHRHRDDLRGRTRIINPGALGGLHREPRQVCLLDLASGVARFVAVE